MIFGKIIANSKFLFWLVLSVLILLRNSWAQRDNGCLFLGVLEDLNYKSLSSFVQFCQWGSSRCWSRTLLWGLSSVFNGMTFSYSKVTLNMRKMLMQRILVLLQSKFNGIVTPFQERWIEIEKHNYNYLYVRSPKRCLSLCFIQLASCQMLMQCLGISLSYIEV